MITIDLESGYDQVLLNKELRPLFGAKFTVEAELLKQLEEEGLLPEGSVGGRKIMLLVARTLLRTHPRIHKGMQVVLRHHKTAI